jgi:hypothetical protein
MSTLPESSSLQLLFAIMQSLNSREKHPERKVCFAEGI